MGLQALAVYLLPDDPTTVASTCTVTNCPAIIMHGRLCQTCAKALKQSGLNFDEFIKSYSRPTPRLTTAQRSNPARCAVQVNGRRCPSKGAVRGFCETHYRQWNKRSRRSPKVTVAEWMASGEATTPDEPLPECLVPACLRESMTSATKVCRLHWARYMRDRPDEPIEAWARQQLPHIGIHQFMLLNLPERLRWEVLYAIQQRSARGGRINPEHTKAVIQIIEANDSLATMTKADVDRITPRRNTAVAVHLHQFARALRNGYDACLGRSAKDALVWDLDDVGFEPKPSGRRPRPRRRECLDFGLITQPWLRGVALAWSRQEAQSYLIVKTHRAAVVASQALEQRTDRGRDMTALGNRDVDAIAENIRVLTRVDNGKPCQTSFKRHIFAVFFDLITWGRRQGLLEGLPCIIRTFTDQNPTCRQIPPSKKQAKPSQKSSNDSSTHNSRILDVDSPTAFSRQSRPTRCSSPRISSCATPADAHSKLPACRPAAYPRTGAAQSSHTTITRHAVQAGASQYLSRPRTPSLSGKRSARQSPQHHSDTCSQAAPSTRRTSAAPVSATNPHLGLRPPIAAQRRNRSERGLGAI